jgi:hypothetical protein
VFYLSMLKGGVKLPATIAGSCVPRDPNAPRLGPPPSNDKPPVCDHLSMRRRECVQLLNTLGYTGAGPGVSFHPVAVQSAYPHNDTDAGIYSP